MSSYTDIYNELKMIRHALWVVIMELALFTGIVLYYVVQR